MDAFKWKKTLECFGRFIHIFIYHYVYAMERLSDDHKLRVQNHKEGSCCALLRKRLMPEVERLGRHLICKKVKLFSIYDKKLETLAIVMAFLFPFRKYRHNLHRARIFIPAYSFPFIIHDYVFFLYHTGC